MAHKIDPDSCAACGSCVDECPMGAISAGDVYKIDPDSCTDCGTCVDALQYTKQVCHLIY